MGDHYMNISACTGTAAFCQPGLSTGMGWNWSTCVLCVGRNWSFPSTFEKELGQKPGGWIHYIGFLAFAGALVHGVTSGTDTNTLWMSVIYWVSGASVLFLTFYRVLASGETAAQRRVEPAKDLNRTSN